MSGPAPTVSIVTPSLNQGRYLPKALASVSAQTYPDVEHVVVDGGSTDGSVELLRSAPGIRWVSEPDDGQSHALNKGFALASGEIFGWLNADDYYLPGAVAAAVAAITESGAGLVYADVIRVDDDDLNPRQISSRRPFDLWRELNEGCGIYSPSVFFTRAAYEEAGGLDEELHLTMDYDLWLRIAHAHRVVGVEEVWSVQRLHADAKSIAQYDEFWPERLRVSRRHGGRLVSPLLINRYVKSRRLRRAATRAAAASYALSGRRPRRTA